MAENIHSDIIINVDTSVGIAEIKNLQKQISALNAQLMQSGAAQAKAAQNIQRNLINNINATGQFAARVKTIASTTETFTERLERNKMGMGELFKYAGGATKTFGRLFKTEFDTIEKVARERVKTIQTQYIKLGRDANGALKAISVRPLALDMESLATKTAIAAQRQQLFNQLLKQGSTNLLNFGKNTQWAGRQLMVGFTIPLAYLGTAAAKTFMKMEEQAIRFKRVYGDSFTATAETDKMIKQVQQLANEFTKYGVAVEKTMEMAANAAAMGKQGADLLAQVKQATTLAVLGGVDQEKALETTISLTNAFGIAAEDLASKIDFLNAVENQTVTSIDDLTTAIPKAGPVIKQLGGNVEDLAFFLTAMREGGINASEGANALKSGIASLINPTAKASEMLGKMGININGIVEANKGNIRNTVIGFAKALDTLDPLNRARAIEQLFGKFQFARLSTLFQNVIKEGTQASRVAELTRQTTQELAILSEREMKRIEESPMYKFKKAVEDLKVSLVPLGEAFLKAITPIIDFAKGFLEKFNQMGDGAKQFAVIATTVIAGLGPVALMTFGLLANGVANIMKLFTAIRNIFLKAGNSSRTLGNQTEYMTQQQLEAAAVAASLDQNHSKLIQTFTSETAAVNKLAESYARAIVAQSRLVGLPIQGKAAAIPKKRSIGGPISGPGTQTSDSIPALLSDGEYVIKASSVNKIGIGTLNTLNKTGKLPGFSGGGAVFKFNGESFTATSPRTAENFPRIIQQLLDSGVSKDKILDLLRRKNIENPGKLTPGWLNKRSKDSSQGRGSGASSSPPSLNRYVQPVRSIFKDEVKRITSYGKQLGLTDSQIKNLVQMQNAHIIPSGSGVAKDWSKFSNIAPDLGYINNYLNRVSGKRLASKLQNLDAAAMARYGINPKELNKILRGIHPRTKKGAQTLAGIAKFDLKYGDPKNKYQAQVVQKLLKERISGGFYKQSLRTIDQYEKLGILGGKRPKIGLPSQSQSITPKDMPAKSTNPVKPKVVPKIPTKVDLSFLLARNFPVRKASGGIVKNSMMKRMLPGFAGGGLMNLALSSMMSRRRRTGAGVMAAAADSRYKEELKVASIVANMLGRSRVATRMKGDTLLQMLASGDTRYRNAFATNTGADFLSGRYMGPGRINERAKNNRSQVESMALGISALSEPGQRPTYGAVATTNPVARILNRLFGGMKGKHFNELTNPMNPRLDQYGDISLIGKRRLGKRSQIYAGDLLNDYVKNQSHFIYRHQQGMKFPPMYGAKPSDISGVESGILLEKLGLRKQEMYGPRPINYIESYTKGGFDLKEISRIVALNPEMVPLLQAALKQQGIKIPVRARRTGMMGKIFGFNKGVVSVPGPKGAGDVTPAMLTPGEAVISAPMSKKYSGLISAMINDTVPGYNRAYDPFGDNPTSASSGYIFGESQTTQFQAPNKQKALGTAIGSALGKAKSLTKGISDGVVKASKQAGTSIAANAQAAILRKIGIAGSDTYTPLAGGSILDNSTGTKYANKAAFDAAQDEIRKARAEGSSYVTKTGKVYEYKEGKAVEIKNKEQIQARNVGKAGGASGQANNLGGGKMMAAGGAVSTAGMMMMMSGDKSGMGNNLMLAGTAMSILPALGPMLKSKIGGPLLALTAIIGGTVYAITSIKNAFNDAQKKVVANTLAIKGGTDSIRKMSEFSGKVSASELMDRVRLDSMKILNAAPGKTTFGESFIRSDQGKITKDEISKSIANLGTKKTAQDFARQLAVEVASGVITEAQASSIASNIGAALGNMSFSINVVANLKKFISPDGKDLLSNPLNLATMLSQQSATEMSSQVKTMNDQLNSGPITPASGLGKGTEAERNTNAVVDILMTAGTGAAVGAAIGSAVPVIGTAVGAVIGTIAGAIGAGIGEANIQSKIAAEAGKLSGEVVASGMVAIQQQKELSDVLDAYYLKKIDEAKAEGNITEQKRLQFEYDRKKLDMAKVTKQTSTNVMAGYVQASTAGREAMRTGVQNAIQTKYKDDTTAQLYLPAIQTRLNDAKAAGNMSGKEEYLINMQLATGAMTPEQVANLLALAGKDKAQTQAVVNVISNFGGAMAGELQGVLNMVQDDKQGSIKKAILLSVSTAKTSEDAQKIIDVAKEISLHGGMMNTQMIIDVAAKNPEKLKELDKLFDLYNAEGDLKVERVYEIDPKLKQPSAAEIKTKGDAFDEAYFGKLNESEQKTYTKTISMILAMDETKVVQSADFQKWLKDEGQKHGPYPGEHSNAWWQRTYAESMGFKATKEMNTVDTTGTNTPKTPTGGSKKDPIDDILNKLRMVRDASIKATGGLNTLRKVLGAGGKDAFKMDYFSGIEQNLLGSGQVSSQFMQFYDGLDEKAKKTYVTISGAGKNAVAKLTADGRLLQQALNKISLGELQSSYMEQAKSAEYAKTATTKLMKAGLDYADALDIASDSAIAFAIATAKNEKEVTNLVNAFKKFKNAQTDVEKFGESYSKAKEAWDAKENEIDIKFRVDTKSFQDAVTAAQNEIDLLTNQAGGLDDLQAGLTQIGYKEDEINNRYDDRVQALDKIAEANRKISEQQKGQLSLADALSKGDLSAAASAIQSMRAQSITSSIDSQSSALQSAREAELDALTADVNGKKLTRKQIEAQILEINKKILEIEEKRLEPANESIRLKGIERDAALAAIDAQKLEWEKLQNKIDLARTSAWDYVKALKEAAGLAAGAVKEVTPGTTISNPIIDSKDDVKIDDSKKDDKKNGGKVGSGGSGDKPESGIAKLVTANGTITVNKGAIGQTLNNFASLAKVVDTLPNGVQKLLVPGTGKYVGSQFIPAKYTYKSNGGLIPKYFAAGGFARGTDTVPAMLTPGEFVVKKYAVDSFGVDNLKAINNGTYDGNSVYNYNLSVNMSGSNLNPNDVARVVMNEIRRVESQGIRRIS